MATKYIIRLPWGEESLPSEITQKDFRQDVGMAFIDWKKGESILKGKNPEFRLYSVKNGKKGALAGCVVFYNLPVWSTRMVRHTSTNAMERWLTGFRQWTGGTDHGRIQGLLDE